MSDSINNVRLEFLRHGPPHNQLLSPLTRYLALCDNHSSVTMQVPYEHREFLARNRYLNYEDLAGTKPDPAARKDAERNRQLQIDLAAKEISELLGRIPGLPARLAEGSGEDSLAHLELVLSASELALLPFELARSPSGCPGEGQPLTLQNNPPVCITRRSRRVERQCIDWERRPRILFAAAAPGASIPFEQHLRALRQAIDPWVRRPADGATGARAIEDLLKVLPDASIAEICEEMRTRPYTHVHLLAHGVEMGEDHDRRFGVRLHDQHHKARPHDIDASQLALALTPVGGLNGGVIPTVVSLASCHGGNEGGVIGAGSSVAHMLHDHNIPLVVASQFPLSFKASVIMVNDLYKGLLWGDDPRRILCALRRKLRSVLSDTHDWASLLAYASLPADMGPMLHWTRYKQASRGISAGFSYSKYHDPISEESPEEKEKQMVRRRLKRSKQELEKLLKMDLDAELRARVHGLLASTEKREGHARFLEVKKEEENETTEEDSEKEDGAAGSASFPADFLERVRAARKHYGKAYELNRYNSWALVQELTITASLLDFDAGDDAKARIRARWYLAKDLLYEDIQKPGACPVRVQCALSNLIEVWLLKLLLFEPKEKKEEREGFLDNTTENFERVLDDFVRTLVPGSYEIKSRIRQLDLMLKWCGTWKSTENFQKRVEVFAEDIDEEAAIHYRTCVNEFEELANKALTRLKREQQAST